MAEGQGTLGRKREAKGLKKPAAKFGQSKWSPPSKCDELRPPGGEADDSRTWMHVSVILVTPSE